MRTWLLKLMCSVVLCWGYCLLYCKVNARIPLKAPITFQYWATSSNLKWWKNDPWFPYFLCSFSLFCQKRSLSSWPRSEPNHAGGCTLLVSVQLLFWLDQQHYVYSVVFQALHIKRYWTSSHHRHRSQRRQRCNCMPWSFQNSEESRKVVNVCDISGV